MGADAERGDIRMPFFKDDDKAVPAMQLIMELETKVRDLRQSNTDLKKAMAYVVATAKPLAIGIGYGAGLIMGVLVGWYARGLWK